MSGSHQSETNEPTTHGQELAGLVALLVMAEHALAHETREVLRERGAQVHWIDSGVSGWESELERLAAPIDVLVHFPPASSSDARAGVVSTLAAIEALQPLTDAMAQRGSGRVIRLLSKVNELAVTDGAAATTANHLVFGMARASALRETVARAMTFNIIALGWIEGLSRGEAEHENDVLRRTPMRRAGSLREVADAIAFLAAPRASFITGATLPVSGGLGLGLFPEQFDTNQPRIRI